MSERILAELGFELTTPELTARVAIMVKITNKNEMLSVAFSHNRKHTFSIVQCTMNATYLTVLTIIKYGISYYNIKI